MKFLSTNLPSLLHHLYPAYLPVPSHTVVWEPYLLNAKIPKIGGMTPEEYFKAKGMAITKEMRKGWTKHLNEARYDHDCILFMSL